jgi:hypothetical protein
MTSLGLVGVVNSPWNYPSSRARSSCNRLRVGTTKLGAGEGCSINVRSWQKWLSSGGPELTIRGCQSHAINSVGIEGVNLLDAPVKCVTHLLPQCREHRAFPTLEPLLIEDCDNVVDGPFPLLRKECCILHKWQNSSIFLHFVCRAWDRKFTEIPVPIEALAISSAMS